MRIGIVSDTHDNIPNVLRAFKFLNKNVDVVLHLGDIVSPFVLRFISDVYDGKIYGVFGNNDGDKLFLTHHIKKYGWEFSPIPTSVELEGDRFLLMHEPIDPKSLIESGKYRGVFYGHTHKRDFLKTPNGIVLNPGETCGYLSGEATFAVLNTETLDVQWINITKLEE